MFHVIPLHQVISALVAQLTCLPSWPTLVWPLTTVRMLSSSRLWSMTKCFRHISSKWQTATTCNIISLTSTHRILSRILFTTSSILAKDWGTRSHKKHSVNLTFSDSSLIIHLIIWLKCTCFLEFWCMCAQINRCFCFKWHQFYLLYYL